jgi:hypothetical protein
MQGRLLFSKAERKKGVIVGEENDWKSEEKMGKCNCDE